MPGLTRITAQAARQSFWKEWMAAHLPAELHARVCAVAEDEGQLVVFADSAAWCARLRYALEELQPQLRAAQPALATILVRVHPRGAT